MLHRTSWLLALTVLIGPPAPSIAADDAKLKAVLGQLLDTGWGKSVQSIKPAQELFEQAKQVAPADPRPAYAMALVYIKHRKYEDANKLLDESLARQKDYVPPREAKVWVLTITKRYSAALVEMDILSEHIAGEAAQNPDAVRPVVQQLGRTLGFLGGPAGQAVAPEALAEYRRKIESRLPDSIRGELEAARKAVDDQFTELFLAREQSKQDALTREAEIKAKEAERLAEQREAASGEKDRLQARAEQAREELDAELTTIDKQLAAQEKSLAQITAQALPIQQELVLIDRDISRLLSLAEGTDDAALKVRYQAEADRLALVGRRLQRELAALDAQAVGVRAEITAESNRRRAAVARYEALLKELQKQGADVKRLERRIAQDEKRVAQPPQGNSPEVRAAAAQALAFTTYVPFPLEEAKRRLLKP